MNLYPIESAFYCEFFAVRLDEIGGKLRKLEQKNILRDTKYVECGTWTRLSLIAADVTKAFLSSSDRNSEPKITNMVFILVLSLH